MAKTVRLPIKVVVSSPKDFNKPDTGGGPRKIFGEVTPETRQMCLEQLHNVEKHFEAFFREDVNVAGIARVVLKEKALAKSHRPSALFTDETCPIVGCGKFGEILISVTRRGLGELAQKIDGERSKTAKANISTIERIEPYAVEDAVGTIGVKGVKERLKKEEGTLRLRLFMHGLKQRDNVLLRMFKRKMRELGIDEPEELSYSKKLKVFKLRGVEEQQVEDIAAFIGTQSVGTFPAFDFIKPAAVPVEKVNPELFEKPDPTVDYPVIGIIDTGTNPKNAVLNGWVVSRDSFVADGDEDYEHGSFVAGLAVHGRQLNSDFRFPSHPVKFIDVVAIPKDGRVYENDLLTILEEVIPKYREAKLWNLSINNVMGHVNDDAFSLFAIALDDLQDRYGVTFVISAGNYTIQPLRGWPPEDLGEADRILQPADSVRGITVGSIAHLDRPGTVVQKEEPSPFSRRGPGAAFLPKPDLSHYGGNCKSNLDCTQVGVRSFDGDGQIAESVGTSFSTPVVTAILANIRSGIKGDATSCLVRALAVHSAVMRYNEVMPAELRYRGFGIPGDLGSILSCAPSEATLIFEPELRPGFNFERFPFPFPKCLFSSGGKVTGEVIMTLAYDPPLDPNAGSEYCRVNVNASLGTCEIGSDGKPHEHTVKIHPQPQKQDLEALYESYQIRHGFKWSPLKVYRRYMPRGVSGTAWNLRLTMLNRANYYVKTPLKVALIVTMRDPKNIAPVYDETVNLMRTRGWITQDLQIEERIRLQI